MKKLAMILMLAVAGSIYNASAQVVLSDKTGWHKIGSKTLDLKDTRAEMSVMGADKFATLRFKVKDAPVTLESVDIYFEDGGSQHVALNEGLSPVAQKEGKMMETQTQKNSEMETTTAGMSKEIKLTDAERSIDKIAFTYKIANTGGVMPDKRETGKETGKTDRDYKDRDNKNITSSKEKEKPVVEIWGLKTNWDKENPQP